jgi:hypothetical protein
MNVAFMLRQAWRVIRNARGIDRHDLQGFVAAWRKISVKLKKYVNKLPLIFYDILR